MQSVPTSLGHYCKAVVIVLTVLAHVYPSQCAQRITEDIASDLAKVSIRKTLGGDSRTFVASKRDTALESQFGAFLAEPLRPGPFIFHVSDAGTEANGPIVINHLSVEGPLEFIVAVSSEGEVFQIKGKINSELEMERLAHRYQLELSSLDAVRRYLRFYLSVNPENRIPSDIESAAAVRETVERKITAARGDVKGTLLFDAWWQQHRDAFDGFDFNVRIEQGGSKSFRVRFYSLSDIDPKHPEMGPALLVVSLNVSKAGKVTGPRIQPHATH